MLKDINKNENACTKPPKLNSIQASVYLNTFILLIVIDCRSTFLLPEYNPSTSTLVFIPFDGVASAIYISSLYWFYVAAY